MNEKINCMATRVSVGSHTGQFVRGQPEKLEDDHVVGTEGLAGLAGPHDVRDERGPVLGPLLLHNLHQHMPPM